MSAKDFKDFIWFFLILFIILAVMYIYGTLRQPFIAKTTLTYYKDIKPYLETGDVFLFKGGSILSKFACCFDPSPFFHVAMVFVGPAPEHRNLLTEHDNSKLIRRDGAFCVDFETKMRNYPGTELAFAQNHPPHSQQTEFRKCRWSIQSSLPQI